MARSNIQSSFRRAGLWPLDRQRILGIPRTASNIFGAKILGSNHIEALFRKKQKDIRASIVDEDEKMYSSRFVNTTAGSVMNRRETYVLWSPVLLRKKNGK